VHGVSFDQGGFKFNLGATNPAGNGAIFKSVLRRLQDRSAYHRAMGGLAFDDLKLFVRVAALGTLSAVARERDVPVSQVSRTLSRLEKTCGARLIHRSTHGLALTAEGETFLDYCQRIAATLESLEADFASQAREASGLVRVAASTVIAQYLLLPSLVGLNARHPRLRVELDVSDRLVDMAREGIDIAIRTGAAFSDTVVARRIGTLGRALYAAPSYAARAGLPAHPGELHAHCLIANSAAPHLNRWRFVSDGQAFELAIEGFWRTSDTGIAANMVLAGLGIGRLATLVAEPLVAQQRLVPVLAEMIDREAVPICAVTASARQRLPKIRACIDYWAAWIDAQAPTPAAPAHAPRSKAMR
jgi:DNA-binding transcriptional LysR family regulator